MTCGDLRELLDEDRPLTPEARRHTEACAACRRAWERWEAVQVELRALGEEAPPAFLHTRLMAHVREAQRSAAGRGWFALHRAWWASLASVGFVAVLGTYVLRHGGGLEPGAGATLERPGAATRPQFAEVPRQPPARLQTSDGGPAAAAVETPLGVADHEQDRRELDSKEEYGRPAGSLTRPKEEAPAAAPEAAIGQALEGHKKDADAVHGGYAPEPPTPLPPPAGLAAGAAKAKVTLADEVAESEDVPAEAKRRDTRAENASRRAQPHVVCRIVGTDVTEGVVRTISLPAGAAPPAGATWGVRISPQDIEIDVSQESHVSGRARAANQATPRPATTRSHDDVRAALAALALSPGVYSLTRAD